MPRTARVALQNTPHHVVQRGHNRCAVFVEDRDYRYYLDNLAEWKTKLDCKVYAYCLMTNHVHLIVDPGEDPKRLGLLMKRLAGRQTRLVNALERRTGSLWEGRYKSSAIETDRYLLACCRYVELNPVRAGMAGAPEAYRWSSYRTKIGIENSGPVDLDPCFLALGSEAETRARRYAGWVHSGTQEAELELIRTALKRGQLTGSQRFVDEVEARTGLRIERRAPGRPRRDEKYGEKTGTELFFHGQRRDERAVHPGRGRSPAGSSAPPTSGCGMRGWGRRAGSRSAPPRPGCPPRPRAGRSGTGSRRDW